MRYVISRRQLVAACSVALLLGSGTAAVAEDSGGDRCKEDTLSTGNFHRFGSTGACYKGAPNSVHDDWQDGLCHEWHYTCS